MNKYITFDFNTPAETRPRYILFSVTDGEYVLSFNTNRAGNGYFLDNPEHTQIWDASQFSMPFTKAAQIQTLKEMFEERLAHEKARERVESVLADKPNEADNNQNEADKKFENSFFHNEDEYEDE